MPRETEWAVEELKDLGPEEALASARLLLKEASGSEETFKKWIQQRKSRMPAAYILGEAGFWNEILEVGPGCLIPRPETETLVEAVLTFVHNRHCEDDKRLRILDLGCGSGAIGVALLRALPGVRCTFSDVSEEALSITRRNVARYGLEAQAEIVKSDLFENLADRQWDVMVSNPPYLSSADFDTLQPELAREPRLALWGGPDGLDFFRRLILGARLELSSGGMLAVECGLGQAQAVRNMMQEAGLRDIEIVKDFLGIDRVVRGHHG